MASFHLGQIVSTPGALDAFTAEELGKALKRHATGDWGDLTDEDRKANDAALLTGERLLSSYKFSGDRKLWIITEADRSATTLLLPEEY